MLPITLAAIVKAPPAATVASPLTRANAPFATIVIVALFSVPLSEIKNSSCVACGTPLNASNVSMSWATPVKPEPSPIKAEAEIL